MRCVGRRGEESKEIHGGRMGRALDFEVKGRKGFLKRTWKKVVEEESVKVGLRRKMHYADQSGVLALVRWLLG